MSCVGERDEKYISKILFSEPEERRDTQQGGRRVEVLTKCS
jgi:hypothetical protein